MNKIELPAIDAIQRKSRGARDSFIVCDMPELATIGATVIGRSERDWQGGLTAQESAARVRDGDLSGVPESDRLLSEMESLVPVTHSFRTINDIVGGVPNVPAFLAGIPLAMRRRQRLVSESAPLALFAELTSSGGINADALKKRGSAILALARVLANVRPIELWAVCGLGSEGHGNYICCRIETAPMDLARAAHVLTHPSVARGICYGHLMQNGSRGQWPYESIELTREHGRDIFARVLQAGAEPLYIPPIYATDLCVTDPVAWIKNMLAQYGGVEMETA